jgi:hypothetical protein
VALSHTPRATELSHSRSIQSRRDAEAAAIPAIATVFAASSGGGAGTR